MPQRLKKILAWSAKWLNPFFYAILLVGLIVIVIGVSGRLALDFLDRHVPWEF